MVETPTLRGTHVLLRPLDLDDADGLARAAAESREHYGFTDVPDGIDDVRRFITDAFELAAAGERMAFTVEWDGRVVGTTSYWEMQPWRWQAGSTLQRAEIPDVVEIGSTWYAARAQRTPVNTETKLLMLGHAFDVWEVHRVSFRTDVRNERSRRAIERLGARLDGIRRADMPGQDGSVRDSAYFSIVRAEWPDVRARLTARLSAGVP